MDRDSLFSGGVGNVQKDPQRFASLLGDVQTRIFDIYADDTWVYPGHGSDTTCHFAVGGVPLVSHRGPAGRGVRSSRLVLVVRA